MAHVLFATDESGKTVYRCLGYVRIATQAHLPEHIAHRHTMGAARRPCSHTARAGRLGADPPAFGY